MALQKLTSLGIYEQVNGGAHRKAASIVGIPSLVRHLGFWNTGFSVPLAPSSEEAKPMAEGAPPPASQPITVKSMGQDPEARRESYRRYVENLYAVIDRNECKGLKLDPNSVLEGRPDLPETGTVTLIRFWWETLWVTIRIELHTEFMTVTSIIDASVRPRADQDAGTPGPVHDEVSEKLDRMKKLFDGATPSADDEAAKLSQWLQDALWTKFNEAVLDASIDGVPILDDRLGEVFIDSRGIVTGSRLATEDEKKEAPDETLTDVLRSPFNCELPRRRTRADMQHGFPGTTWARKMLHAVWPFVESDALFGESEFTVTGFFQGRVLFITALGPQSEQAKGGTDVWTPIRYLLHAYTDDEWQLGRLVERIITLGTLRLAGTMEIGAMKKAGGLIETLMKEIDDAQEKVQEAIRRSKSSGAEDDNEAGETARQAAEKAARKAAWKAAKAADAAIARVNALYQKISNEFTPPDIHHRLERSQYYVERFRNESADLREKRVEGFQTYTEFVTRRMDSIFGYIQFLKTRMETIEAANSSLDRQYASLKITSVTCGIDGLVGSMTKQDREITKIQEFGEIALIGALIPYYVSTSVIHLLALGEPKAQFVWAGVTAVCCIVVIVRICRMGLIRRLWFVLALFIAYTLVLGYFFVDKRPWLQPDEPAGARPPMGH